MNKNVRFASIVFCTFLIIPGFIFAETETVSVWERLLEGNQRFVSGKAAHPNQSIDLREKLAKGQKPIAVVVTCSDSRVSPELVFDQGLGDLFVIRTAGNIVDSIGIGSIEYAVEHLGTSLVVVMGHESCGAVKAALHGGKFDGGIQTIVDQITKNMTDESHDEASDVNGGIAANVRAVVRQLSNSQPILSKKADNGLNIIGARYSLETGLVEAVK